MIIDSIIPAVIGPNFAGVLPSEILPYTAVVMYDMTDSDNLRETSTGTGAVVATDPVGLIYNKSWNGRNASQAGAARPTAQTINSKLCLASDHIDDYMTVTMPAITAQDEYIATPYGYQHNTSRNFTAGSHRIPICYTTQYLVSGRMTARQRDVYESYLATDQKFMVGTFKNGTTEFKGLRLYGTGMSAAARTVRFIDANGTTLDYTHPGTNNSYNVNLSSLDTSRPVLVLFPLELAGQTLRKLLFPNNYMSGCLPDLSSFTSIDEIYLGVNQFTGTVPSFSTNTSLTYLNLVNNQLTGQCPSLAANILLDSCYLNGNKLTGSPPTMPISAVIRYFEIDTNALTGSIPPLAGCTGLIRYTCANNQLTGYLGGGVPSTLVEFRVYNNKLTQTAVDLILSDFVAAGASGGVLTLAGGTNATPSAAGLANKVILQGRGWTVTNN